MADLRPQHVLWITADHMRFDCVGALGNPAMRTPNLDRLAAGGVSFTNCFVQNPLCMPSRCSFMTGLYPQQTGVDCNGRSLPADFAPTVAGAFRSAGYQATQIGKLHLENHEDNDLDPRPRNGYGFDVMYLAEEPGCYQDAYIRWLQGERPDLVDRFRVSRPSSRIRVENERPRLIDAPWKYSFSGWVACQFENFFNSWGGRGGRHFVHLGFYAPHPPLNPTREMYAAYENVRIPEPRWAVPEEDALPGPMRSRRRDAEEKQRLREYRRYFYAMVTGVDMAVGHVLECLAERDLVDDTLIVFSSDHGDLCGDHTWCGKNLSFFDEIMHVPLIMFWPRGFGHAQRRIDGLVEMVDVLPTLLGLLGQPVPKVMAGMDLSAGLAAGKLTHAREDVYAYHAGGHVMLRTPTHKYVRYRWARAGNQEVLFDLGRDPGETANRAGDPSCAGVMDELRGRSFDRTLEAGASILPLVQRF